MRINAGDDALNTAWMVDFMYERRDELSHVPAYVAMIERAREVVRRPLAAASHKDFIAVMCTLELYARHTTLERDELLAKVSS